MRSLFAAIFLLLISAQHIWGSTSQLYTGDAVTVLPGKIQLQSYYDTTFGGPQRIAGASSTFGMTKQSDVRLGYGYLWNDVGPDVRLGPNVGVKWRVLGDGNRKPSLALSALYAIGNGAVNKPHNNDYGGLLIIQYPTKPAIMLINYGHAWIGGDAPDLRYFGFAAARYTSHRTLIALEYTNIKRINNPDQFRAAKQITAAVVYTASHLLSYSAQYSILPPSHSANHLTLGININL